MNLVDLGVLVGCALVGWLAVSWLITLARQQRAPPVVIQEEKGKTSAGAAGPRGPSVAELGKTWQAILQVPEDAGLEAIEAAYHQRIAECDTAGAGEQQQAEQRRATIEDAYNFIRAIRMRH